VKIQARELCTGEQKILAKCQSVDRRILSPQPFDKLMIDDQEMRG